MDLVIVNVLALFLMWTECFCISPLSTWKIHLLTVWCSLLFLVWEMTFYYQCMMRFIQCFSCIYFDSHVFLRLYLLMEYTYVKISFFFLLRLNQTWFARIKPAWEWFIIFLYVARLCQYLSYNVDINTCNCDFLTLYLSNFEVGLLVT